MRGQSDALRFPAAEGLCGAVEFQVVEADTTQEVEALSNLGKDVAGNDLLASGKLPSADEREGVGRGTRREGGDALPRDEDRAGDRVQSVAAADRAGTGLSLLPVLEGLLGGEVGLEL